MASKKSAEIPITATMLQSLPSVYDWMRLLDEWPRLLEKLAADLVEAERMGSIPAARAFLALKAIHDRTEGAYKAIKSLFDDMKEDRIPDVLDLEGVPHVPLDEGYRIGTSETMYVSIVPGKQAEAMAWLRKNASPNKEGGQLADLIIETINASTLSAAGRFMLSEHSEDLPADLFKSYFKPTTTVTKIPKR